MKPLLSIAHYTITEQIRNRLFLVILFFGFGILASSLLVGALAPGHRVRVIFDLGLVAIELFGLSTAVFGAVSLVLQEMETKTIYLIVTRPLNRSTYIVGRFLGLVGAVTFTMIVMSVIHAVIMVSRPLEFRIFLDSVDFWSVYPVVILMSIGKMVMTTAIALFFSLFATSAVSALIFTGCFWVAGHFGTELTFMISQSLVGVSATVAHMLAVVLPNYQYFNYRDTFSFPNGAGFSSLGWAWLYGIGYTGFFLVLSSLWFSKKEF